ncbi:hypothetical protein MMC18_009606 [Xylographa bjoerkii]|nr:hypothetical protein [Xylographa bjoerkii]
MSRYWPYTPLSNSDSQLDIESERPQADKRPSRRQTCLLPKLVLWVALFCFAAGLSSGILIIQHFFPTRLLSATTAVSFCIAPPTRREWRSFSASEKHAYIEAVQCLRSTPSAILPAQSLYDDFPYVHMHVGNATHETTNFLPWHRYFVHVYETALRGRCNYTGHMAYWDWTLDWANFRDAPVWDSDTGFGGSGGADAPDSVGEGTCVTDGPFAGLQELYWNLQYHPHCLSRGFPPDKVLARWTSNLRPEVVEQIMAMKEYEEFYLALENGPHLAIPYSVRGDFYAFTAPNDPIFFLHHTQLDRLWWQWQQSNADQEVQPTSKKRNEFKSISYFDNVLDMGTLAANVTVVSIDGALLALTALSQLFHAHSESEATVYTPFTPTETKDAPNFEDRGIDLDLCCNRISPRDAMLTIDAMSFNKFHRLHLHPSDSQSWLLEALALPALASKGAYHESEIWTTTDLQVAQLYGVYHGIEVYLETDLPGHTTSIALAHPSSSQHTTCTRGLCTPRSGNVGERPLWS